jgi:hypothetical protein
MDDDLKRAEALLGEAIALVVEVQQRRPDISVSLRNAITQMDAAHFWVGWLSQRREENTPPGESA